MSEPKSPDSLPDSLPTATVQELHLELLRRTQYNNFHGDRILKDLLAHRDDWRGVLLDNCMQTGGIGRLVKLRDIPHNFYNADTLYILAVSEAAARRLSEFAEVWMADTVHVRSSEETDRILGGSHEDLWLVEMWWD